MLHKLNFRVDYRATGARAARLLRANKYKRNDIKEITWDRVRAEERTDKESLHYTGFPLGKQGKHHFTQLPPGSPEPLPNTESQQKGWCSPAGTPPHSQHREPASPAPWGDLRPSKTLHISQQDLYTPELHGERSSALTSKPFPQKLGWWVYDSLVLSVLCKLALILANSTHCITEIGAAWSRRNTCSAHQVLLL